VNSDQKMLKSLEALSRAAFLRAMEEPENGIGLAQNVETCLLSGLAIGDLTPISEHDFIQEMHAALNQPMGGFFKKLKKGISKIAKHANPVAVVKTSLKITKKVAKKTLKAVKKAAPYAAAGAAIYFGAPYLLAGGTALYNGAKNMMGGAVSPALSGGKAIAGKALTAAATAKATQIATKLLTKDGVNMKSPESQQALQQYMAEQTAQYMPPPPAVVEPENGEYNPAPKTDLIKYALPVAGLIAAAALL
jgi:hypothetical protein